MPHVLVLFTQTRKLGRHGGPCMATIPMATAWKKKENGAWPARRLCLPFVVCCFSRLASGPAWPP